MDAAGRLQSVIADELRIHQYVQRDDCCCCSLICKDEAAHRAHVAEAVVQALGIEQAGGRFIPKA